MQHILFDTDGVLVHSEMWSTHFCRENTLDPLVMKPFFSGIFQDCIIGQADLKEVISPFLKDWGWKGNIEEYLKSWFDYENKPDNLLMEKIQELREKGTKCHVATNQEKYRLEYLKKEMHFENLFDSVFCSAEIGYKKPREDFYSHIMSTLGVDPSEIIYFDDDEKNIETVRKLGIRSILYRNINDISFI